MSLKAIDREGLFTTKRTDKLWIVGNLELVYVICMSFIDCNYDSPSHRTNNFIFIFNAERVSTHQEFICRFENYCTMDVTSRTEEVFILQDFLTGLNVPVDSLTPVGMSKYKPNEFAAQRTVKINCAVDLRRLLPHYVSIATALLGWHTVTLAPPLFEKHLIS
ncbi:hypothetical protein Bhyg_01159 [Pseudolycoriella hygida]|uniref:Uncharacterized protein n=1 Tax=Pseudolycoriella hygida TaxID=35572 RepID=A0A9Q0S743_9DIPT|nr:hypothetical protein Bhyg_01159 [Pseudolycoriella hygida]